jgi:flagellar FliL protein
VANFEAKGQMRFLQVSVEIMTRDPVTADLIKLHDPMIRNDLLMLFGNQQYESISTLEGKDKLRGAALAAVAKVVGAEGGDPKKVEQLYFTSFVMQ